MSINSISESDGSNLFFTTSDNHEEAVSLAGLEHIFHWASEMVSTGEDARIKLARERKVRRHVLEVVQKYQQQRAAAKSKDEVAYLQRRVIALLQKLQDLTEENAAVKQIMVSQFFALQRVPELEAELRKLRRVDFEREAAVQERRTLMDALARLKVERDFLEDTLTVAEKENDRLSDMISETRTELNEIKARRWWHAPVNFIKRSLRI
ncbi:MAG: hypothetical protein K8F91_10315 [Candidatus Obscuribacterales bacterium]|nr:hypothetical protein [Candidatus Obscuribacterales bacterium]